MKRLKTIAKILIRDLDRNFDDKQHKKYAKKLYLYMRVLLQDKNSKHKIYSLHEPHAYAVGKGKDLKNGSMEQKPLLLLQKTVVLLLE